VYENGALRGAFLGQQITEGILPDGEDTNRQVTIAGPGPGDVLRWPVVMTAWYPNKAPETTEDGKPVTNPYNFKRITRMGAWKILLQDAQKRGTVPFVCPNFDKTYDSGGEKWPDLPEPLPDPSMVTTTITDGEHILFFIDSHTLTEAAQGYLATFCDKMKKLPAPQVTCVGHTDSTNTIAYNQALSERRAKSVADFIKSKVPHAVITHYGRGELEPVATNATVHGRELNRRVVVTYPVAPDETPETYFGAATGTNLLDVLNEWTGQEPETANPLRAEWFMQANFRLDARVQFGTRREKDVVFYEGSVTTNSKVRDRRRADIRNFIAGQDTKGIYLIKKDATSVKRWRQREIYLALAANEDPTVTSDIVQANLELQKNEIAEWTIQVPPYAEGRRIFEDYSIGDWVGIARFLGGTTPTKVEAFRVMAITLQVDQDGPPKLELTLQSTIEAYLYRLKQRLSTFMTNLKTTKVFIQDEEPPNAKIGDLWTPLTIEED
jgi:outer membrane protein OmpA-like peptidoglycan-associated protein